MLIYFRNMLNLICFLYLYKSNLTCMHIYQLNDIFTPSSPAKLTFVEREHLNKRIVRALNTKGMQIIVYGQSGSGKTTLLENKLFQVYERHLKTSCMKGMSLESVILDAFDQLAPFYLNESSNSHSQTIDVNIKASYIAIDAQIKAASKNEASEKYSRVAPPQLTAQSLARFMGAAEYCWILDDFHKIEKQYKLELSQLMKVFMDMSNEYPLLKIICVGAVNKAREVVEYDEEMRNRVSQIKVPLMNKEEINQIMNKGFSMLNLKVISNCIYDDVFHYSNGLASICHKLCLLMCESINVYQTYEVTPDILSEKHDKMLIGNIDRIYPTKDDLDVNSTPLVGVDFSQIKKVITNKATRDIALDDFQYAVNEYLDDASDSIKYSFDAAFNINGANQVLEALSEGGDEGESIEEVVQILWDNGVDLEISEVKEILANLQTDLGGSIVIFDNNSHAFRFSNPFLMTFARTLFEQSTYRHKMTKAEMNKVYTSAMKSLRKN